MRHTHTIAKLGNKSSFFGTLRAQTVIDRNGVHPPGQRGIRQQQQGETVGSAGDGDTIFQVLGFASRRYPLEIRAEPFD